MNGLFFERIKVNFMDCEFGSSSDTYTSELFVQVFEQNTRIINQLKFLLSFCRPSPLVKPFVSNVELNVSVRSLVSRRSVESQRLKSQEFKAPKKLTTVVSFQHQHSPRLNHLKVVHEQEVSAGAPPRELRPPVGPRAVGPSPGRIGTFMEVTIK